MKSKDGYSNMTNNQTYIAHGLTIKSNMPFSISLNRPKHVNDIDVYFEYSENLLWDANEWQSATEFARGDEKNPQLCVKRQGDEYFYYVSQNEQFRINLAEKVVQGYTPIKNRVSLQIAFIEEALALFCGLQGKLVFHGACVADTKKQALLLLADSGGGKSSLTTQLVKNGSFFVADDVVILHDTSVYPSHGYVRLNGDSFRTILSNYLIKYEDAQGIRRTESIVSKKIISAEYWGLFQRRKSTVAGIMILDCNEQYPHPSLMPVQGISAMQALLHSIYGIVNAQPSDTSNFFSSLSQLITDVPIFQFQYPRDYTKLASSADFLLDWLQEKT